jgi:hypothetical protein
MLKGKLEHDPEKWMPVFGKIMLKGKLEHDPEKACPGPDPGWIPVFGKNHAPRISQNGMAVQKTYPAQKPGARST